MKMKIKKKVLYFVIAIIFSMIAFYFLFEHYNGFSFYLSMDLIGEDNITLNLNDNYDEEGAKAFYNGLDISDSIEIDGKVDNSKIGIYDIKYLIKYKKLSMNVNRKVSVVDNIPPVLTLNGKESINLTVGDKFEDSGVVAIDNYDGDISSLVETISDIDENKPGSYKVTYTVKDSSQNETSISRTVIYGDKIEITKNPEIAVLNYHFFYDSAIGESCNESICLDVKNFRAQLDYLKQNDYKTLTMEEFKDWMYGKIEIPEKSVLITIDDGAMGTGAHNGNKLIPLLEEYEMHATLFLITGWWDISNYSSPYLDVESHTNDMHLSGKCAGVERGAQMLCSSKEKVLEDLRKSIEITGSANAFCFPFYAYNNSAIESVKEAGFSLAFVGGNSKANRLVDKYKIPRYPIQKTTSLSQFIKIVN